MDYLSKNLIVNIKKDIETINKNQSEIKIAISEIKNSLEGINSRLDEEDNQISALEDNMIVST